MDAFGAVFADTIEVTYVNGVSVEEHSGKRKMKVKDFSFHTGLARVRFIGTQSRSKRCRSKIKKYWNFIRFNFCSFRLPFYNLIRVVLDCIWIALFGTPLLILVCWVCASLSILEPSLTASHFTILDVFMPNSENPWWVQT